MDAEKSTSLCVESVGDLKPNLRLLPADKQVALSFRKINYTTGGPHKVNEQRKDNSCFQILPCFKKPPFKQILFDVSGVMKPGLNAIMGPTGSGKSSLLDILAGRKDPNGLSGQVLIDGSPLPKNFKRISGYVVQQDIVLGTLTVRENLWFSANLRLPRSVSRDAKSQRINEILFDLGLTGCADTKVGNEMIRGISGGEKKRASIAIELITAPTVLFLDEPTTGLDASTANAVMLLLNRMGRRGRTIICSIHQPRYSIFRLFDSLTLLSLGRLAYHGPYDKVLPYFENLGYHCQEHNNPADFFLDVINGDSTALASSIEDASAVLDRQERNRKPEENGTNVMVRTNARDSYLPDQLEEAKENNSSLAEKLAESYSSSELFASTQVELSEIFEDYKAKKKKRNNEYDDYATPFYYQFGVLSKRAFKNVIRNPIASVGNLVINIIVGVVFGLLFYQVDNSATTGTQNRFGVLFFIVTNLMFSSISATEVFNKEKDIFIHEYVSGYYRVVAYFLSKLVADLIPMRTISPIIFGSVTYWMVGLKADVGSFFIFVLFLILVGYAATAIALFFSATFSSFAVASIFISLTFVFSILFAGLLLNVESVLPWLAWIKYLSIAQYGFSGLSVNEFRYSEFRSCSVRDDPIGSGSIFALANIENSNSIEVSGNETCFFVTGEEFVNQRLGIGNGQVLSDWDLWVNVVSLSCITLGMFTLTYIQLMRTKTTT